MVHNAKIGSNGLERSQLVYTIIKSGSNGLERRSIVYTMTKFRLYESWKGVN